VAFSPRLALTLARYLLGNKLRGTARFPLVLMLEPSFRCNLACRGCGRIREYAGSLGRELTAGECLAACAEAGAPVVSITGGEPLVHREIAEIVAGIIAQKRFVHLCTNGVVLERSLSLFVPSPRMSLVVHIDGMEASHDALAGRAGVFRTAVAAIRAARRAGFRVYTNTTVYNMSDPQETEELLLFLADLGVNGVMLSPAFHYEAMGEDLTLARNQMSAAFQRLSALGTRVPFYNTPPFMDFLAGRRELDCKPWSTPTRNPLGWKQPCYLITDGHCSSFAELMAGTRWESYGPGRDPRCADCKVHCGFEASAVEQIGRNPAEMWRALRWTAAAALKKRKAVA
jgi:hopanoid biosynthesis associated radical SAM protein HpnH